MTKGEVTGCAMDSEMYRRRGLLARNCREHTKQGLVSKVDPYKLFVIKRRRLLWCPVYKAASTNWMKNLPRLSGLSTDQVQELNKEKQNRQVNVMARAVVPYVDMTNLSLFLHSKPRPVSFLTVRNPFDRLLSAYRDKLERYNGYYYKKYGRAIVKRWRPAGIQRFGAAAYSNASYFGSPHKIIR